jgi:hypothetical protein
MSSNFALIPTITEASTPDADKVWAEQHLMWCILNCQFDVNLRKHSKRWTLEFEDVADMYTYKLSIDKDEVMQWTVDEYHKQMWARVKR